MNYYYFKNSFAALLALSAPEPPPLVLLLLDDLPLDPFFFEVSPAFSSTNFLASFPIFSAIRANHTPFSIGGSRYLCFYPKRHCFEPPRQRGPQP